MIVKVGIESGDLVGNTDAVIQQAVDAAGTYGGGTVELGPGVYTMYDAVRLRRNVRLVGSGEETILRKCDGAQSQFAIDADYGQTKVTVEDPTGFRIGMGVVVRDDRAGAFHDTAATITLIQGNTLYVDQYFVKDYDGDTGGIVCSACSLVAGVDVDSVVIEGIRFEGNREKNLPINGCIGGGIYFYRARKCRIADCVIEGFSGDGISFQTTQDFEVERCEARRSAGLGFHPGTGSARTLIRGCRAIENDGDGLFLCWRVQDGRFENNEFVGNGHAGISIGHKDTDNVFVGNTIQGNAVYGIYFRDEKPTNAGSRNEFRENAIEDNGTSGVHVDGYTTDLLFEHNTIRDTREADERSQRFGILVGPNAKRVKAVGNQIENHVEADTQGDIVFEP